MTDPALPPGADPAGFPTLTGSQVDALLRYGTVHAVAAGEVLYAEGDDGVDFIVVLDGSVDIVRRSLGGADVVIVSHGPGRFVGELGLLTGQRPYLTARAAADGRVLRVGPTSFRTLLASETVVADLVVQAFMARRRVLEDGEGAHSLELIGSTFSPETLALRQFLARNRVPHVFVDLDAQADPAVLLAAHGARAHDVPVVVTPTRIFHHPTPGELAEHLGLTYRPVPGRTFDVVVVGAGPAGLAAAVYGASEGLDVVVLDSVAIGGQASSSARIENYLGFPGGVSGGELTSRAAVQAQRFGARIAAPCEVATIRSEGDFFVVGLADESEVPTRSIVVATGARYRTLALEGWAALEGRGIYYAATAIEGRSCAGTDVVVIGAGNSAGQAALFLAGSGARVSLVVRRDDPAATMSSYLLDRIEAHPAITVRTRSEVVGLTDHDGHLVEVAVSCDGDRPEVVPCKGLFCFIGADPHVDWLPDEVARDADGFILTDRNVTADPATRPPLPFETAVPGLFAVGDCRAGSMKRVAAAVGEGSSAIRAVHQHLGGLAARPT